MRAERLFPEAAQGLRPVDLPRQRTRSRKPIVLGAVTLVALVAITAGLSRLRAALPTLDRATLWIDRVQRGPFVREAHGPGTLQPEHIRWLTADNSGRVERLPLRPGAQVKKGDLLVDLSNPDVQLNLLESQRQLAQAEADLLKLRAQLGSDRLSQAQDVSQLEADAQDAARRAAALTPLAKEGAVSKVEERQQAEKATALHDKLRLAQKRLALAESSETDQVAAQRAQVTRLQAVVQFRKQQLAALSVRAPEDGVLQDLPLELGQWVTPGALLAKVARPDRLKAELRIPETQARDLAVGQRATVDTHAGLVRGKVSRVSPAANQGAVLIDVSFDGELPRGARPDLSVEGSVELEEVGNTLFVGRPSFAQPDTTVELFRLVPGTNEAARVKVRLGKASASAVQVLEGLSEGDRVVLSDTPGAENADHVRIKP